MPVPTLKPTRSVLTSRLATAGAAMAAVLVVGATGYHVLGRGHWSWLDCFYMTVITLSTVGYGEVLHDMDHMPGVRIWTVGLIVLGSGSLVYFVSTLTAWIVEGDLRDVIRKNRMKQRIDELEQHVIVCGVGTTGIHVVEELEASHVPYVVVEKDEARLVHVANDGHPKMLFIVGDASEDHVLQRAGIARARGVVAALHDDPSNLYVTVTARALNAKLRIVAKAVEHSAGPKLLRAGADAIVSPNFIGGMRLVSEMVRPHVVQFLDQMLRDKDENLRIEELSVTEGSSLAGLKLGETNLRSEADVLVVAIRKEDGRYAYNPKSDALLAPGMVLILLARAEDVVHLRAKLSQGRIGRRVSG